MGPDWRASETYLRNPLFAGYFGLNEPVDRAHRGPPFRDHAPHDLAPAGRLGAAGAGRLCAADCCCWRAQAAFAQGKLEAQYEATLAGIPVGKGGWTIDISDDQFAAAAPAAPRDC